MVKTQEINGRVAEDPVILRMRKDTNYRYVGNYVKPRSEFVSEGYKEFVSAVVHSSWGDKVISRPRGGKTYTSYESPVHKPLERIKEEDFQGPFEQCDNPLMEKIIYKNQKIYFGLINKKFVAFTVFPYYDKKEDKRKKGMILHKFERVDDGRNNRNYLKAVARATLTDLMKKEIAKLEDEKKRAVFVFRMNWPEYNMYNVA